MGITTLVLAEVADFATAFSCHIATHRGEPAASSFGLLSIHRAASLVKPRNYADSFEPLSFRTLSVRERTAQAHSLTLPVYQASRPLSSPLTTRIHLEPFGFAWLRGRGRTAQAHRLTPSLYRRPGRLSSPRTIGNHSIPFRSASHRVRRLLSQATREVRSNARETAQLSKSGRLGLSASPTPSLYREPIPSSIAGIIGLSAN